MLRKVLAWGFATAIILTATSSARAQTGAEYLRYCEQFENAVVQRGGQLSFPDGGPSNCWHFFIAFRELADVVDMETGKSGLGLCIPTDVPLTQLIRIFTNYAEAHPDTLQTVPAILAWQAVWQSFHCDR
jgi:hypothetical protein